MTTSRPRQTKTPRQRAEETLGVAQRRRDRLVTEAIRLKKKVDALDRELADAEARLTYAQQDLALSTTDTPGSARDNNAG